MNKTKILDDFEFKLHIGRDEKRLYITAVATNIKDEKVTFTTNMGSWCNIQLIDNTYNVNRLDSTLSTAAIKNWELEPNESIVSRRKTTLPSEIDTELEEMTNLDYTKDPEEYQSKDSVVHFIPNLDLSEIKNLNIDLKAILKLEFGNFSNIEISFQPSQIKDSELE